MQQIKFISSGRNIVDTVSLLFCTTLFVNNQMAPRVLQFFPFIANLAAYSESHCTHLFTFCKHDFFGCNFCLFSIIEPDFRAFSRCNLSNGSLYSAPRIDLDENAILNNVSITLSTRHPLSSIENTLYSFTSIHQRKIMLIAL